MGVRMSDLYLAMELLEQGQRDAAVRELEKVLSTDIDNISAWRLLAQAVSDPVEVKECYEHILRLDPEDAEAIHALRGLGVETKTPDIPPFFTEDIQELSSAVAAGEGPSLSEPIDTAPVETDESPAHGDARTAEASLFDEEDNEAEPAHRPRGLFENDALFYTIVVLLVVIVAAILVTVTGFDLLGWIQSVLPF